MSDEPTWRGGYNAPEPPDNIRRVCDENSGQIADRLDADCEYCGHGNLWRWRDSGGTDCWLDIDGIGPWIGWER